MGKDVKRRFTVSLDIDTKDAEKQVKSTVGNLKSILADLGNASDKMGYFKELVDYVQQIDAALTALKNKNADAFNHMFDGLDTGLKQVMESIFDTSSKSISALDELRTRINSASENGAGVKELRSMAEDINNLFVSFGKLPPIDIEGKFTGKGNATERINILKSSLDDFATVWDGVNNKIKNGFSFGGNGDGSTGLTKLTDAAQKEINKIDDYQKIIKKKVKEFYDALIIDPDDTNKLDSIKDSLKNALSLNDKDFEDIQDVFADLEFGTIEESDAIKSIEQLVKNIRSAKQEISGELTSVSSGGEVGKAVSKIGESADKTNDKLKLLSESIKNVFMAASQLEVDVRNDNGAGKETMSLFDQNGVISKVEGTDYQVDTDALVQQLVSNLKQNIVMSLHNHSNGLDVFSPSDVESFAKLYYGQGTKINGIIANGIVKTIDFSGISQEVAENIARSYSENISNFTNKFSDMFSFNDGEFDFTDKVKQLQITDPSKYAQIVSDAIDGINACLNDAFIKNGVEPTIQVFQKDELSQLAKYLSDIEQSGQNAIDPIEKLKNLITALNPNQTFDWSQFADIFDKFKNGAIDGTQALNQILNFKTVAADAKIATASIDQAEAKVKEFLALTDEIHNKSFDNAWDATDNVEIGKYTERLNSAKAALDELGDQGQLTAEQLEQVNNAFNQATKDLDVNTKTYDAYASDSSSVYDYYDDYERERDKADQLEQENESLREQLSKKQQTKETQSQYDQSAEMTQLDALQDKLIEVKTAVEQKTQAFKDEVTTVGTGVDTELVALNQLLEALIKIIEQINLIKEGFASINGEVAELNTAQDANVNKNIPTEVTNEKAKEVISQDYALDSTLVETNGILNQILAAIGNNESLAQMIEPLNAAVTELKNVSNGIIEHQKSQRTDLTDASSRIANNYGQLSSITGTAVAGIGNEVQIKQMKALADNVVKVEGAVRDADGVWKGFVVDINESNQAVVRAVNEQSDFAKALNESANAAKNIGENTNNSTGDKFTQSLKEQVNSFNKYRENLKDVSYISDDVRDKLDELGISLRQVKDAAGLDAWKNSFSDIQKAISLAKDTFTAQEVGKVNQAKKTLEASFKTLDFKTTDSNLTIEQQQLVDGYMQAKAALEAYKKSASQGNQIELSSIQNVTDALYKQIEAYKQAHNIVNAGGGNKKAYGTNAATNATAKYNSLSQIANGEFSDSSVIQKALNNYTIAYQRLIDKQKEFKAGEKIGSDQEAEFKQLQTACNSYAKELNNLITASRKFADNADNITSVDENFEDSIEGRKKALQDYVQVQYGASAKIGEFKKDFNELTFTIDNGNGTFTKMAAAINPARNAIGAITGDTEKATTAFGRFFGELKGKFRTISTYLISSFSLQEVWQQIRQGINYVKEIDSALTELKKVTDETEQTYQNFLNTASKTAGQIGSTVADFTNATADFARLGYSIEEASNLAEAASVYKNVGD